MAFDRSGKYHMSPHHAKMADGFGKKPPKEGSPSEEASEPKGEAEAEGDPTKPGPEGETADGSDVPKILEDLHAKHGGKHMHVHAHEAGVTTHHIGEDGMVEGPHEHPDMAAAADHMHMMMGDGMGQTAEQAPVHSGHPMMAGY